jgi:hypothetical protein
VIKSLQNVCQILEFYGRMAAWNLDYRVKIIENKWDKVINEHSS